jgi:hypothetical protein
MALVSMRSRPEAVTRRNRFSPGLVEICPRSSARFVPDSVGDHEIPQVGGVGDHVIPHPAVT